MYGNLLALDRLDIRAASPIEMRQMSESQHIYVHINTHTYSFYIHILQEMCVTNEMGAYIHAYIRICMNTYMHTCIHTYIHTVMVA